MVDVYGPVVDDKTRCVHYHSDVDIIAIKFRCCDKYYPCYQCHEENGGHAIKRWSRTELDSPAAKVILCGECKKELTFDQYSKSGSQCIGCKALFNPGCALHYDIYFDLR